jgi:hypothetical protein
MISCMYNVVWINDVNFIMMYKVYEDEWCKVCDNVQTLMM